MLAVLQKFTIGTALSSALVLLSASALAEPPSDPNKQWACSVGDDGNWQCEQQNVALKLKPAPPSAVVTAASAATVAATRPEAPITLDAAQWYWVTTEQLSGDCDTKPGCNGAYVLPENNITDSNIDPANAPSDITADRSDMRGDDVRLAGNVLITQGYRQIKAAEAHINTTSNQFSVTGGFEIQEPGVIIAGDSASFDSQKGTGSFNKAQALSTDTGMRITGEKIERTNEDVLKLSYATFTQCTPDDETWKLEAENIELDNKTGFGTAKNVKVRVLDVPILYTPYLSFPIDERRMSGFLWPTIAYSSRDGAEISTPFYFNIAPNYDATYIPRYLEKRGLLNQLEARYLNENSSWVLSGGMLSGDKGLPRDPITTAPAINSHIDEYEQGMDRWVGSILHNGKFAENWSTRIDYTQISDSDYFRDFDTTGLDIRKIQQLNQTAQIAFNNQDWVAQLTAQQYQTIDNNITIPYRQLPRLFIENRSGSENFATDWLFKTEFTAFDHLDSYENGGNKVTGNRSYTEAGVSFPMNWAQGFIIPTVKVRHLSYQLDKPDIEDPNADYSPDVTAAMGTLDMGLFFERQMKFSQSSYTQTLEPRLYYFAGESKDQQALPNFDTSTLQFNYNQLFRDTRFSGYDRLDGGNQLTIAVTNRFYNNQTGQEIFTLSMGEIIYFKDRTVTLGTPLPADTRPNSNFAAQLQYSPSNNLYLSHTILWDHREGNVDEAAVGLQYRSEGNAVFYAGYLFRRDGAAFIGNEPRNLEQFDLSMILPMGKQWTFFSRVKYDATENRALLDATGLEYEECCWLTRLVYKREVENEFLGDNGSIGVRRDYAFVLEFQLKGLGSLLGGNAENILRRNILGYSASDD